MILATRNAAVAVRNAAVATRNAALAVAKMRLARRNTTLALAKMELAVANAVLATANAPLQRGIFGSRAVHPALPAPTAAAGTSRNSLSRYSLQVRAVYERFSLKAL